MREQTIYFRLKEATATANVIEAAESGYVSLNDDFIRDLDRMLARTLEGILQDQKKKISGAATPEI